MATILFYGIAWPDTKDTGVGCPFPSNSARNSRRYLEKLGGTRGGLQNLLGTMPPVHRKLELMSTSQHLQGSWCSLTNEAALCLIAVRMSRLMHECRHFESEDADMTLVEGGR